MNAYGPEGRMIKGKVLEGLRCPNCGHESQRSFGVVRYFHLCGIPVIPITKKVGIECAYCRWIMLDRQVPEPIREEINSNLFAGKRLLPIFAG